MTSRELLVRLVVVPVVTTLAVLAMVRVGDNSMILRCVGSDHGLCVIREASDR